MTMCSFNTKAALDRLRNKINFVAFVSLFNSRLISILASGTAINIMKLGRITYASPFILYVRLESQVSELKRTAILTRLDE